MGTTRKFLQAAARDVEGCVNRHGSVFTLSSHFQVLRALFGFEALHLKFRGCIFHRNAEIDPDLGDAATAFVSRSLNLYAAANKPVVEFLELRQFAPDPEFNSLYGLSVAKFDQ